MKLILFLTSLALANAANVSDFNRLLGVENLVPAELASLEGDNSPQGAVEALSKLMNQPETRLKIYQQYKVSAAFHYFQSCINLNTKGTFTWIRQNTDEFCGCRNDSKLTTPALPGTILLSACQFSAGTFNRLLSTMLRRIRVSIPTTKQSTASQTE